MTDLSRLKAALAATIISVEDAVSRLAQASAETSAIAEAQAKLPGALERHRTALQDLDLGLVDKATVADRRRDVHDLQAQAAARPTLDLAEAQAAHDEAAQRRDAAHAAVLRAIVDEEAAKYRVAAADALRAQQAIDGIQSALSFRNMAPPPGSPIGPLHRLVIDKKELLGATIADHEAARIAGLEAFQRAETWLANPAALAS